ncbi:hypothetical protein CH300_12535 [Rhodococcus sp. 15-1154-1]|nr:hypothetical protein CH300_12535 [Rhodococcus sp. 15-1154-1]
MGRARVRQLKLRRKWERVLARDHASRSAPRGENVRKEQITMDSQLPLHNRIGRLFEGFRHLGTPEELDPQVAAFVSKNVGRTVSVEQMRALRSQAVDSPDQDVLEAVATFFEAPVTYLVGTVAQQMDYNAQLDYFDNVRQSQATVFALRTRVPQLTPAIAERLSELVRDTHERFETQPWHAPAEAGEST